MDQNNNSLLGKRNRPLLPKHEPQTEEQKYLCSNKDAQRRILKAFIFSEMGELKLNEFDDKAERVYDYMYAHYKYIFDEDEIYYAIKEAKKDKAYENIKRLKLQAEIMIEINNCAVQKQDEQKQLDQILIKQKERFDGKY